MNTTPLHLSRAAGLPDLEDAEEVLGWATDTFGERVALATSLGPQSLVILDLLHRMGRPIPVFFLDTGLLFDETYALRVTIEDRYGVTVQPVTPRRSVAEQARDEGPTLWARDPDRCCALRKVAPLRDALVDLDAWITGLRRDQSASRAATRAIAWDGATDRVKVSPLATWSRDAVLAYLRDRDVPFNPLLDRGYRSVGCWPCTRAVPDGDERAGRWAGTEKTECGIHHLFTTQEPSDDR